MVGNAAVERRKKRKIKKKFDRLMTSRNHVVLYQTEFLKTTSHIRKEVELLVNNLCRKGLMMMMLRRNSFSAERTADIHRLQALAESLMNRLGRAIEASNEIHAKLDGLEMVPQQLPTLEEFCAMKLMDRSQLNAKWRSAQSDLESMKTLFEGLHNEWEARKEEIVSESQAILSKYFSHEINMLEENPGTNAQG